MGRLDGKVAIVTGAAAGMGRAPVHPGLTRTAMLDPNIEREFTKRVPLARVSEADEVSSIGIYLASDDSSYSTGAEFIVDGGLTAQH